MVLRAAPFLTTSAISPPPSEQLAVEAALAPPRPADLCHRVIHRERFTVYALGGSTTRRRQLNFHSRENLDTLKI
jgi:hypothetical protein